MCGVSVLVCKGGGVGGWYVTLTIYKNMYIYMYMHIYMYIAIK